MNNDFNDEKRARKYLDRSSTIIFRTNFISRKNKTYFTSQLDRQIAPTIQKLNSVHVLINLILK